VTLTLVASECDAFWQDGLSGEAMVNKSWLALLYAVFSVSTCSVSSNTADRDQCAIHHMSAEQIGVLFPDAEPKQLVQKYFDAALESLHEGNWMSTHSL
jgi:hypothetical protein